MVNSMMLRSSMLAFEKVYYYVPSKTAGSAMIFQEILTEISCFQEILPCTHTKNRKAHSFRKFQSISGNFDHTESCICMLVKCRYSSPYAQKIRLGLKLDLV